MTTGVHCFAIRYGLPLLIKKDKPSLSSLLLFLKQSKAKRDELIQYEVRKATVSQSKNASLNGRLHNSEDTGDTATR